MDINKLADSFDVVMDEINGLKNQTIAELKFAAESYASNFSNMVAQKPIESELELYLPQDKISLDNLLLTLNATIEVEEFNKVKEDYNSMKESISKLEQSLNKPIDVRVLNAIDSTLDDSTFTTKKAYNLDFIQLQSLKDDVKNISMEISIVEMKQNQLINQTDVLFNSRLMVLTKVLFTVGVFVWLFTRMGSLVCSLFIM